MYALCCGLSLAMSGLATPAKELRVEIRVCKGDPLGSVAGGGVRYLGESNTVVESGRPAKAQAGGEVPLILEGDKVEYRFLGTVVEVAPVAYALGQVWIEVNLTHSTQAAVPAPARPGFSPPVFSQQGMRGTYLTKLGDTFKQRISANDPADQVWVEVTIRAADERK